MGRGQNVERNSWVRLPLDTFHFPFEYLDKNKTQYLQNMYKINKMKRIEKKKKMAVRGYVPSSRTSLIRLTICHWMVSSDLLDEIYEIYCCMV